MKARTRKILDYTVYAIVAAVVIFAIVLAELETPSVEVPDNGPIALVSVAGENLADAIKTPSVDDRQRYVVRSDGRWLYVPLVGPTQVWVHYEDDTSGWQIL